MQVVFGRRGYKMIVFTRLVLQSIRHGGERSKVYWIRHRSVRSIALCDNPRALGANDTCIILFFCYMVYHKLFGVFYIWNTSFVIIWANDVNPVIVLVVSRISLIYIDNVICVVYSESENIKN
jgi:hypothetical protein